MLMFGGIFVMGVIVRMVININNGVISCVFGVIYGIFVLFILFVFVLVVVNILIVVMVLILMLVVWNMSEWKIF